MVALTAPINATGLFELDQQSEMLFPFEGLGVDTSWEFRMPRPANLLDYGAISDVLVTIDYAALDSFEYHELVAQQLSAVTSADRPFSFRHELADQWYDLHNPDQTSTPMTVRWTTTRKDFPPNLDRLTIRHVALYFSRGDDLRFEIPVSALRFNSAGRPGTVGGGATSIDGLISTRRGNAGSWMPMIGRTPEGEWELSLPDAHEIKARFTNGDIDEMLFVITYSGRTPEWP
jgi:Tc toxin complex TcA C-terminal TcB-binding domain